MNAQHIGLFCWMMFRSILGVTAISLILSMGCVQRSEDAVVIYCATDREAASPILDAYERAHAGTEIVRQYDVEASKTLGLVTRIEQESKRPRCDVLWNNEILHTLRLQQLGLLAKRRWKIPDNWPKSFRASDGSWVGFAARARVLLVNRDVLKDTKEWPSRVAELGDEKWQGKCGFAYPIYGTTATHMSVLATHPGALGAKQDWKAWLQSIKSNAITLAGNKQVALAVSSGELAWGLTDTDDAILEVEGGKNVAIVFPDQTKEGFGSVFIPNTIAMIEGAPHPVSAGELCDFLVSERIESRLAMSGSAQFPLWPDARESSRIDTKGIRWAEVDFEAAAQAWESTRETLLEVFPK